MTPTPLRVRLDGPNPAISALAGGIVHAWRVALDQPIELVEILQEHLSPAEHAQAQRFVFEHDWRRYIVAHAVLRAVLGAYVQTDPVRLEFDVGPRGKPSLSGRLNPHRLRFNMSHSGQLALIAITCDREVGVDVECVRDLPDALSIARHFFCESEQVLLEASDGPHRCSRFFRFWTRKEALIKATGDGLWLPLTEVDVSAAENTGSQRLLLRDGRGEPRHLRVEDLAPAVSYAAAIAVEDAPALDVQPGAVKLVKCEV